MGSGKVIDPEKPNPDKLFTQKELRVFGVDLRRAFPLPDYAEFDKLLRALDRVGPNRDRT
jgi:hypothetical protein